MSTTTLDQRQGRADREGHRAARARARAPAGRRTSAVGRACCRPTTATSPPRTSSTAADVDLYGALASHYKLAADRPAGHRAGPGVHPDPRRARLVGRRPHGRRGRHRRHAVPRRLGDHGARRASSATCTWSSTRSRVRRDITGALQSVDAGRRRAGAEPPARRRARVVDARRDRPRVRDGEDATRSSRPLQRVLRDVREVGRGLAEDARPGRGDRRRARRATRRRCRPRRSREGRELLRWLADDHFTFLGYREYHLERATGDDELPARRARHRPRHPARRPGHVGVVRQAAAAGRGPRRARRPCWC